MLNLSSLAFNNMAKKPKKKTPNYALATNYIHIFIGKAQEVRVGVHINYATGHITLIDINPQNPKEVQGKKWVFANRSLEYMQGWRDILDAMRRYADHNYPAPQEWVEELEDLIENKQA